MRSDFVEQSVFEQIFPYMTPANVLAVSVSLSTGLRIGDVVALRRKQLNSKNCTITFKASKTGKDGRCVIPWELCQRLRKSSGEIYIFEGKSALSHRTRQAVWANVKTATDKAGITDSNVTPHSARKNFAVNDFRRLGDLREVQAHLQHSNILLTEYYATSDKKKITQSYRESDFLEQIRCVVRQEIRGIIPLISDYLMHCKTQ